MSQSPALPAAPYPPSLQTFPSDEASRMGIRSALSSSPAYTQHPLESTAGHATTSAPFRREAAQMSAKSRVLFCPSQPDVYACINCAYDHPQQQQPPQSQRSGPILLELRRLHLNTTNHDGKLFHSSTLAVSQGNPSFGTSVTSTCMAYPLISNMTYTPCATGLTTGALCIHTFNDELTSSVSYFSPRHQRQASAVAWRPSTNQQVAIGLVASGSSSADFGGRRGGGGGGSRAAGDREFCCLLYDVTKGTTTAPVSKLSHNVGVASLAWLAEGKTLCVGSQARNFHLYDLRISGTTASPISTWAHTDAVNGIETDPQRPEIFATFGRTPSEPVKLWDCKRMDSAVGEIKTCGIVSAIQWSHLYPGMLSVALGDTVQHYDTTASLSRPVLTRINHTESQLLDLALYPRPHTTTSKQQPKEIIMSSDQQLVSELCQNRMLVVLGDRTVLDIPKHTTAPCAISRRDGRIAHAFCGALWVRSSSDGPSAMESPTVHNAEDISARMMRRAKCSQSARYSMDATLNIQMLITQEEKDGENGVDESNDMLPSTRTLIRLWSWIERIEKLCSRGSTEKWPAKGFADSGVLALLQLGKTPTDTTSGDDDAVAFDESLSCNTYDSPSRRVALTSCGWAGTLTLEDVQADCEAAGEFERSAALAVWHGDIGASVEALQRGADAIQGKQDGDESSKHNNSPQYAETLQLVSMCIAGYRGNDPKSSSVWRKACLNLLQRDDLSGDCAKIVRVAYLRAVCMFLVRIGTDDGLKSVLHDEHLSICDRMGFAVRFLEQSELRKYLDGCVAYCRESGNLEGLIVTGVDKQGLKILQAYVDKYADVQTAALVCSRATFTGDWERSVCLQWLDAYRALLNTWQMWQSRAMFDVDVADYLSKLKARQGEEFHGRLINYQAGRRMLHPSIPAQLDARCNKCSKSLTGLRGRPEGAAPQRLAKANPKPVLSCCPSCLNALPRCSICLLSLGCLNPYMEVKKERANLPIAEWFTWCMRCKHGGHAHHLVGWFANHEVCPVSGCDCRCQFDAMQKLNRCAHVIDKDT